METTIRPPGRWGRLGLRELWAARELLYFMTKRDLQIRYKQSFFGVGWAVLQPLALTGIFALFFGRLANVPSEGLPYPVFALAGLVPWIFVASSTMQAALSLVEDANLLSKVYFPRLVIPIAKSLSLLVDLVLSLVVLTLFAIAYDVAITPRAFALVAFLLLALVTALGVGISLAAVNVKYRDVALAVPLLVQAWLFATPVIYPGSLITGALKVVYSLNPMVSVIDGVRWALLGTPAPNWLGVAVSCSVAVLVLVGGIQYFRRTEAFFADLV
jgi:homopolymeric O-antigen transport system permease protein